MNLQFLFRQRFLRHVGKSGDQIDIGSGVECVSIRTIDEQGEGENQALTEMVVLKAIS